MARSSMEHELMSSECAAAVAQGTNNAFEMAASKRLGAIGRRRSFDAGQILFLEGDRARNVFIVAEGCIKLYKMLSDGRRQITAFLFCGDFLGMPIRSGRYVFTAEALTCAQVFSVPMERIEILLGSSPTIKFSFSAARMPWNGLPRSYWSFHAASARRAVTASSSPCIRSTSPTIWEFATKR